jgi:hypothetical protein
MTSLRSLLFAEGGHGAGRPRSERARVRRRSYQLSSSTLRTVSSIGIAGT